MRYVVLWEKGGGRMQVIEEDHPRIDAAVSEFVNTSRDGVLNLTTVGGDPYSTLASNVHSWSLSTPEGRCSETHLEAESTAERRALRQEAGLPWEDE